MKEKKRRFHQGPRVTTLNFEAGYMHAVLPQAFVRDLLQTGPTWRGSFEVLLEWESREREEAALVKIEGVEG